MARRDRVKGIKKYKDRHGKLRCYHRKTGTAIQAEHGTAAFLLEVEALDRKVQSQEPLPGSLGLAIKAYLAWDHFKGLAEATQAGYQRYLKFLDPMADMSLKAIDAPFLASLRDQLKQDRGQRQANYVLSVIHNVFEFSIERGWTKSNPVPHVKRAKRPKGKRKANRPWSLEERRMVLEEAPWQIKVPLALAMFTGLRKRDCLTLPKTAIRDGVIHLNTSKTGEIEIPVHPGLQLVLEAAPAHEAATVAATTNGTPWTESGFNSVWDRFKDKLEEDGKVGSHLTIHGLRHTVGDMLADAEASLDDIRRALGQKTLAMAQHYSERAKKRSAVRRAVEKIDPLGTRECLTQVSNPVATETNVQ
jgi:integrase